MITGIFVGVAVACVVFIACDWIKNYKTYVEFHAYMKKKGVDIDEISKEELALHHFEWRASKIPGIKLIPVDDKDK